jgi:hypothetical protein
VRPHFSALALVSAFVATRWATRSLPALFSEAIAYIRLDTVRAAQRRTTELELASNAAVLHAAQLDGADATIGGAYLR